VCLPDGVHGAMTVLNYQSFAKKLIGNRRVCSDGNILQSHVRRNTILIESFFVQGFSESELTMKCFDFDVL
jgi:hypothetical protein